MNSINILNYFVKPILPEIILLLGSMLALIIGVFKKSCSNCGVNKFLLFVLFAALCVIPKGKIIALNGFFISDQFIVYCKALLILSGGTFLLLYNATRDVSSNTSIIEFPILITLSLIGMMVTVSANDLLIVYMGIETQSLCLYVLAAFERDSRKSSEAGVKYFVLGSLASGILLYGISLIYGFTGSTNFGALSQFYLASVGSSVSTGVLIGLVMVIAGLCFKIAAAPLHMWAPDVYQGSPTIVTAFFALVPKIAITALMVRLLVQPFGVWVGAWQDIIIVVSICSMFIGSIGALLQTNIKRLLAYSAIGHIGYMLIGIASGSIVGVQALLIYITIYVAITLGVFTCIMLLKKDGIVLEEIASFAGLAEKKPFLAFCLAAFMLSLAGIPPLAGFFGKFYIFISAVKSGLYMLAIIGLISSVIAAYYYLKIIKTMYFDKVEVTFDEDISKGATLLYFCASAFNLLFFAFSEKIIKYALIAGRSLFS
jgi:NADH-quinone oxidoreductase subunit N